MTSPKVQSQKRGNGKFVPFTSVSSGAHLASRFVMAEILRMCVPLFLKDLHDDLLFFMERWREVPARMNSDFVTSAICLLNKVVLIQVSCGPDNARETGCGTEPQLSMPLARQILGTRVS